MPGYGKLSVNRLVYPPGQQHRCDGRDQEDLYAGFRNRLDNIIWFDHLSTDVILR